MYHILSDVVTIMGNNIATASQAAMQSNQAKYDALLMVLRASGSSLVL
jgi:hypothetical protein